MKNDNKNTFEPHINAEREVPALCFAPNHYLSCVSGHRFQVSADEEGNHDIGSSITTLNNDLVCASDLPEEIRPLIAFSHMCEAAAPFDDFWSLICNDPKLVNNFIAVTNDMCGIYSNAFDISNIGSMIQIVEKDEVNASTNDPNVFVASRPFSCVIRGGNAYAPLGNLILSRNSVQIQDSETGMAYKLTFPDYRSIGADIKSSEKEYYGIMWNRLTWILFGCAGLVFDNDGCRTRYGHGIKDTPQNTNEITDKNIFFDFVRNSLTLIEDSSEINDGCN